MAFLRTHLACDDCSSSDGMSIDDKGWSYCFVCETRKKVGDSMEITSSTDKKPNGNFDKLKESLMSGQYKSVVNRGISSDTCKAYKSQLQGDVMHFGYHDKDGYLVGAKTRSPDKDFRTQGNWKDTVLFGQNLFTKGGKYITITEGEYDAMSAYQMLGSKYPVVSIKNGSSAALKDCRSSYEYLDSYENIVVCFDADESGMKAANQVAELFGGKAKVFKHTKDEKDANDYVKFGRNKEFVDRWWASERFVPDGIVAGSSLWDEVNKPIAPAECLYPYEGINKLTYGIRFGELVTVTAGSGLGKSQFMREIIWQIISKTEDNIGILFLEESIKKAALSLMSLAANKPLHLPDTVATDEERLDAFNATLGTDRVFLFDHFGSTGVDNIVSRVRYMAKGLGCKYVVLDHVSIVVSAQANGDERKALDEIMTRLRMLVQETGIALFIVSHLKRPDSKGHEEGAATSLSQLRGSGSIAQLSDMVLGLERNGQAEDPEERNTTHVRVLKNRFCGITGKASPLLYDHITGRMLEVLEEDEL
jgi:twinkle protein